ncbi:MAG: endolytic transglycosylase MltG [Myxococcota bacterium]
MARRLRRRLVGLVALVLLAALSALGWLLLVYARTPLPGPREHVVVELPSRGPREVASALAAAGVIETPTAFAVYLRVRGVADRLRDGSVLLATGLSPREVARRITRGQHGMPVRVTIPEGLHRFEIAERLEAQGICSREAFLDASAEPPEGVQGALTAEGYLFPDTYDFHPGSDPETVVSRMVANFRRRTDELWNAQRNELRALQRDLNYGPHQVLTLASVVEEEAAVSEERAVIAGVFLNRLRSETFRPLHRLQADPTVSYGCLERRSEAPSCAVFAGRLSRAMLNDPANPYNTYRHGGLPPGPITNPGLESLRAVLRPAQHNYLYFVARGGGRHEFSEALDQHNDAVDRHLRSD